VSNTFRVRPLSHSILRRHHGSSFQGAHRFGSFVVVDQNGQIKDLVRPWTKKLHLYLTPHPLLPIRLVVVVVVVVAAVVQEHEL